MTTDNQTNGLTAEQILVDEWIRQADRAKSMTGMDAIWFPDAEETLAGLRAHGLLSEGAPTEAQIERAAVAMQAESSGFFSMEAWRHLARVALTAAGVAPQVPNQNETKSGSNFVSLAPEKVAEVIEQMRDRARKERDVTKESLGQFISRALCEAYKEGKLT